MKVAVDADRRVAARLAPEWEQVVLRDTELPADLQLLVVGWPRTDADGDLDRQGLIVDNARRAGIPVLLWDDGPAGSTTSPLADAARLVRVCETDRARDYPGTDVAVLDVGVQPRDHNPVREGDRRMAVGHIGALTGVFNGLAGAGPLWRAQRPCDVLVVGIGESRVSVDAALRAGAAGSVVVTSDPAVADAIPGVTLVTEPAAAEHLLTALEMHEELRRRSAQPLLRHVLAAHSSTVAVDAVLADLGLASARRDRAVSAVVPTMRPEQIGHVLRTISTQRHDEVQLVLVTHGFDAPAGTTEAARDLGVPLMLVPASSDLTLGSLMNLGVEHSDGEFIAKMDDDNHYGPHYLADLLDTFDFSGAQVAGKWAHYTLLEASGAMFLRFPSAENTYNRLVQGGTLVMPREVAAQVGFEDLPRRVDTTFLEKVAADGGLTYSADRYGFVSVRRADVAGHTWKITDAELLAKPSSQLVFADPRMHVDV